MSTHEALKETLRNIFLSTGYTLGDHTNRTDIDIIAEEVLGFFQTYTRSWLPIDIAPQDRPVLVWHDESLATGPDHPFNVHKGLSSPATGVFIAVWVAGQYNWWFERDSSFGQPLMPGKWMPLPTCQ
jgi:hypothetical protein